jgi:pyruvate dehydrogenase E2 component (dihydrolipoamide acetyltransferase)
MATKVVMEALSPTMEEGRLVAWTKHEGDVVKAGDTIAEVETDKAVMELVARADGVLRRQVTPEGATVPVGALVAVIGAADEDISAITGADARTSGRADERTSGQADERTSGPADGRISGRVDERTAAPANRRTDVATTAAAAPDVPLPATHTAPAGRVFASPLARRLATERGVDLRGVAGSGPGGRIVKRDVEAAPTRAAVVGAEAEGRPLGRGEAGRAQPGAPRRAPELPTAGAPSPLAAIPASAAPDGGYRDVPLTQIRKTIAKRLAQSLGPIPHFFLTAEIDMEQAAEMREQLKARGDAFAFSVNDIIVKAVALALRQHPALNAAFLDDRIRYYVDIHVGNAVAVEDGLITPVIRHTDRKGLVEIAAESRALAERARARKLQPDEYTGATFSVSNLGMYDIDQFTAVINPPEAAILAVGRVVAKPVAADGAVVVRRMMRVTLSCDHRVVDGATGARFLQSLKLMLENPLAMLL